MEGRDTHNRAPNSSPLAGPKTPRKAGRPRALPPAVRETPLDLGIYAQIANPPTNFDEAMRAIGRRAVLFQPLAVPRIAILSQRSVHAAQQAVNKAGTAFRDRAAEAFSGIYDELGPELADTTLRLKNLVSIQHPSDVSDGRWLLGYKLSSPEPLPIVRAISAAFDTLYSAARITPVAGTNVNPVLVVGFTDSPEVIESYPFALRSARGQELGAVVLQQPELFLTPGQPEFSSAPKGHSPSM